MRIWAGAASTLLEPTTDTRALASAKPPKLQCPVFWPLSVVASSRIKKFPEAGDVLAIEFATKLVVGPIFAG